MGYSHFLLPLTYQGMPAAATHRHTQHWLAVHRAVRDMQGSQEPWGTIDTSLLGFEYWCLVPPDPLLWANVAGAGVGEGCLNIYGYLGPSTAQPIIPIQAAGPCMHANIPDIPLVLSYLSTQVVMPTLG